MCVVGVGLCQAVAVVKRSRRVRVCVVEGALVGSGRVGMEERALDLLVGLVLVVVLLRWPPVSHFVVHVCGMEEVRTSLFMASWS